MGVDIKVLDAWVFILGFAWHNDVEIVDVGTNDTAKADCLEIYLGIILIALLFNIDECEV